ncbi:hypothetical protein MSAN_01469900 [Mycena sanguinolenta]|uniref:DUF6534 domain-containing protein n=1 Tax=Mycena sanguinolenta TaxID=230812 RepID=A0A8H6YAP6_9AGAR|nr:hypothetical protein MSAN_01469900 [Mycena sanguinolenta]
MFTLQRPARVFGVITLLCYVTMVANFIWIALVVITARLFSNSLLTSLNSRATLRAMKNEVSATPVTPVPMVSRDSWSSVST